MEIGGIGGELGGGAVVADYQGSGGGFSYGDAGGEGVDVVGDANDAEHVFASFVGWWWSTGGCELAVLRVGGW